MSIKDWADAIPHYYDDLHPEDEANQPAPRARQYVTSSTRRWDGHYPRNQTTHIVVYRLDYLPNAWMPACRRVIRGTVSATPPLRLCKRCVRETGG